MPESEIQSLIPRPRETYVRQREAEIRTAAGHISVKKDPVIAAHVEAVLMAEDLADAMQILSEKFRERNRPGDVIHADSYDHHHHQALQLKYYHLDKLAALLL